MREVVTLMHHNVLYALCQQKYLHMRLYAHAHLERTVKVTRIISNPHLCASNVCAIRFRTYTDALRSIGQRAFKAAYTRVFVQ